MENLTDLAHAVAHFATAACLPLIPAVPVNDLGPEVQLTPDLMELPVFLDLAKQLGGGALYLHAPPFAPDDTTDSEVPARLLAHTGDIGDVAVAFVTNGVLHIWRDRTAWFLEWQHLTERAPQLRLPLPSDDGRPNWSEEDRARIIDEGVTVVLAHPEFRAARGSARQRAGRLALPADFPEGLEWRALREATDQADELAKVRYAELSDRLDELAAELVTDPEYLARSSAAARKQVATRFLIARADGLSGPSYVREELHSKAMALLKLWAPRPPRGTGAPVT